jgi:2-keto-4-pentenoate hydratase/2-oxohepta-3-ene-1,7-dioic acid hydratase in catechol pathway
MRLVSFRQAQGVSTGALLDNDEVVDVGRQIGRQPVSIRELLTLGRAGRELLKNSVRDARERLLLKDLVLAAPIHNPTKFLGLGYSYRSHVNEVREQNPQTVFPKYQVWFNKQVSCIVGPYDAIHRPCVSHQLDYEGELAVVIGSTCRHVERKRAADVIAGFMVCNDVSVRDWQLRTPTATLGKSFDTHGPTGPWVTLDLSVAEAEKLWVRTKVNWVPRQNGNTSDFIYSISEMIEELSTVFTLEAGDILATGTPSGVGALMDPPQFLKAGDVVSVEIQGLGIIENRVIDEPCQSGLTSCAKKVSGS